MRRTLQCRREQGLQEITPREFSEMHQLRNARGIHQKAAEAQGGGPRSPSLGLRSWSLGEVVEGLAVAAPIQLLVKGLGDASLVVSEALVSQS
jgi:hypothetical protein